jgi:hypothetical protein
MPDGIRVASEEITDFHILLTFGRNKSSSWPLAPIQRRGDVLRARSRQERLLRLAERAGVEASIGRC